MKRLKQLVSAAILSILTSTAIAQNQQSTGNLITNTWTGTINYTGTGAGTSGGASAGYNSSTNTIYFGYTQQTASQLIGINTALQGTGIQVNGYNWSWDIYNLNGDNRQNGTDTLTAIVNTRNAANQIVDTFSQTYNTQFNWTAFSGTRTYTNPYLATDLSTLEVSFSGRDSGFWAGYYGPQVRNVAIGLNYTVDQCAVNPQSSPTCPGYKTYYNMSDDGYAQVNLPFSFPFYGNTYTTSYMFTNGVVGFLSTNLWGYCCDGVDLNQQAMNGGASWNFAIYALNTDLYPGQNSQFYTQETDNGTGLKYTWENVVEIGTNNENTFSVNIKDSGYIGINYEKVNLSSWRNPLIGIAGDISQGQYSQYYYGPASNLPNLAGTTLQYNGTETTDICAINPLYNQSCPGYQQAYLNQQCSANPLYDASCPGYQQAYYNQQCSANPLYDVNCPGYATAYYNYQCSADPLYHTGCPGYEQAYFNQQCTADPLYSNQCSGYQQAYFDQQCALDGLYNTACPNYADAYYVQQCTISPLYDSGCTGYAEAYFSQQCGLDPLYNNQCPGYDTAFFNQQCSISALYNNQCPGYTEAYFSQQCSLDGLYDTQCPNYQQASCEYQGTGKWVSSSGVCVGLLPVAGDSQISNPIAISNPTSTTSDPVASAAPVVADPVVNQAITTTATSASPAQSATATVPLVQAPAATSTTTAVAATQPSAEETTTANNGSSEEKKEETKTADSSNSSSTSTSSSGTASKDQPKTTRQALAERRLEAARAKAIEDGKQLANKMGEAASIEAQIQVQAVVVAAMSFVPGFDNYSKIGLPDVVGYKPFEIYKGQRNVDNPAGRRFLTGADARHQEMVDQQYNRSE